MFTKCHLTNFNCISNDMLNSRLTILTRELCERLRDFPTPRHLNLLNVIKKGGCKEWLVCKTDIEPKSIKDLLDCPSNVLILMPPILLWTLFRTWSASYPRRTILMLASRFSGFSKFGAIAMCASLGSCGFSSKLIISVMRPTCLANCSNQALLVTIKGFKTVAICCVSKLAKSG